MKKLFSLIGSIFVIFTLILMIFAPNLCVDFLIWCGGRIHAIAVALAAAAEDADTNSALTLNGAPA